LKTNNSLSQIGVGIKRYFNPDAKINPYFSTSYIWQKLQNLQINYEFRNANNEEIKLTQEPIDQINYAQYLSFGTGLNYRFYKKWTANFGINYQRGLKKQVELPNLFSAFMGVGYRF
jgi:long-subunit fatty acid transport protein